MCTHSGSAAAACRPRDQQLPRLRHTQILEPPARASKCNFLWLLPRLAFYEPADMDPRYRAFNCSKALVAAVENDNLVVVQWLHANRHEGCTENAMDFAALNGHLEAVKWLHENRSEGCTANAMYAARMGHFEVLLFSHANRNEGCNSNALVAAVRREDIEVAQWLCEKHPECVNMTALRSYGSLVTPMLDQLGLLRQESPRRIKRRKASGRRIYR